MFRKKNLGTRLFKFSFVVACFGGFLYQTSQFLLLYWTYPTVVDIQKITPSSLDLPSFTFCNPIGYNFEEICNAYGAACSPSRELENSSVSPCNRYPTACFDNKLPEDFTGIDFQKFMQNTKLRFVDHDKFGQKLQNYLKCEIEYAGEKNNCNLENVIGSFYSEEDLPQYCYTIFSLWGKPEGKRDKIAKGAKIKLLFNLNATRRPENEYDFRPRFNLPLVPSVQIAVHSPYFLPSPYPDGANYPTGRAYTLRITMEENHLLPSPYQTNCTNYLEVWKERNGKAPISPLGEVQECRANKTFKQFGCVPLLIDYPHEFDICPSCTGSCQNGAATDECILLTDKFNQPCDSFSYSTIREDRVIIVQHEVKSIFQPTETINERIAAYDCEGTNVWTPPCSELDIEVIFDRFQVTMLTYKPKFESLEMFSVIGGYMGMWLGISFLTIYDYIGTLVKKVNIYCRRKIKQTSRKKNPDARRRKPRIFLENNDFRYRGEYSMW